MYQEHFGFERRPFGAVPDIGLFVDNDSNRECLDAAMLCLESGQGIAILTAPAGLGKTIVCHKLAASLTTPFVTVLLANSNFGSARAMLQSFLFELGRKYVRLEEQELRLELITALRTHSARDEKVVLIVDEAEHLTAEILEEIRNLANLSDNGQPLLRVVLSGQPQLEERLLEPDMTALNQRIRCQLYLQPLTRAESMNYVADQLQICGQISELVIQDAAMDLMVHAADGNPRCLNQLADHSLLLAYMSGERPVSYKTVRDALDDLKRLPLQWNDPGTLATDDEDEDLLTDEFPVDNAIEQRLNQQVGSVSHVDDELDSFETGSDEMESYETDSDETGSYEVGGETEQSVVSETRDFADEQLEGDQPKPEFESFETPDPSDVVAIASFDDEQTAVFEVGADDDHMNRSEPANEASDANPIESVFDAVDHAEAHHEEDDEEDDEDEGDIIELPDDEDSYVAYESTVEAFSENIKPQGIAAFADADEFSESYELNLPEEPVESELDIPLVPLGSSIVDAPVDAPIERDSYDEEGPTLSLVDRLSEDDGLLHDEDDESADLMEDLETFASQAINLPADETHEEVVFDRYAMLDAGNNIPAVTNEVQERADDSELVQSEESADAGAEDEEHQAELPETYDVIMADPPAEELEPSIAVSFVGDLGADLLDEEREMLGLSIEDEVYDIVHPPGVESGESTDSRSEDIVTSVATQSETIDDDLESDLITETESDETESDEPFEEQDEDRTYANLFSRLRRLQLAAREMDDQRS